MHLAITILLGAACAVLIQRVSAMEQNLRSARKQLKEREASGSSVRIRLETYHPTAEALLREINSLLELHQTERLEFLRREESLCRQIANISHDLRTPLTSILGYLQLLQGEGLTEEERREYLTVVEGRSRTLQTLITAFYDLSRLEGGEYPLERERVSLYGVLSELLSEFYGDFETAGFDMEVELAEGLPPVWGDQAAVVRVFTNLIGNALRYGTGRLSIRLEAAGEKQLRTAFSNNAPGLTQEDMAHLFDRFYTADQTRSGGSTGLGLSIVKALAGQMGCTVRAALERGVFTLEILWEAA